jgi:hypothetical protein
MNLAGNDVRERLQKVEAALMGAARGLFTTVFRFLPGTSASSQSQQPKRNRKEEREAFRAAVFDHYKVSFPIPLYNLLRDYIHWMSIVKTAEKYCRECDCKTVTEGEEITSFQPHQADKTTYEQ